MVRVYSSGADDMAITQIAVALMEGLLLRNLIKIKAADLKAKKAPGALALLQDFLIAVTHAMTSDDWLAHQISSDLHLLAALCSKISRVSSAALVWTTNTDGHKEGEQRREVAENVRCAGQRLEYPTQQCGNSSIVHALVPFDLSGGGGEGAYQQRWTLRSQGQVHQDQFFP